MAANRGNFPIWLKINAWREICARVFENIETKPNVSPDWLINPATNRRLKLDLLYPEIGVAVRFEGLQGKNRRQRPSLEEEIQQRTRDTARVDMCRANGIELIVIDAAENDLQAIFQAMDLSLSRAKAHLKNRAALPLIDQARTTASAISRRVRNTADLKLYADLWEDRQYQAAEPGVSPAAPAQVIAFTEGMEVEHTTFGPGVVLTISAGDGDTLVTVDFVTAGQKTLAASLVADKLIPR